MFRSFAATVAALATIGVVGATPAAADPPPITASFDDSLGILTVTGDDNPNTITINSDAAGNVLVNGGTVPVSGVQPTMNNTILTTVAGNGGQDNLTFSSGTPVPPGRMLGGEGSDVIRGGSNQAVIDAGPGNDFVISGQQADWIDLGPGDDGFVWTPGGESDHVDGRDGDKDQFLMSTTNDSDTIDVAGNGARVDVATNVGDATVDASGFETAGFSTFAGADEIKFRDLTGTGLARIDVDLVASNGSPDVNADRITVVGSPGPETISVSGPTSVSSTSTASLALSVRGGDPAMDRMSVSTGSGDDSIDASRLAAGIVGLTVDPGSGTNTMVGSPGPDIAHFWGSHLSDAATLSNAKTHAVFTDDNSSTDLDGVETVAYDPGVGTDQFTVGDVRATDVTKVRTNLVNDLVTDTVRVVGTNKADVITAVADSATDYHVEGMPVAVEVVGNDTADQFFADGLAGNDSPSATVVGVHVRLDGGTGNDTIHGGRRLDDLLGGGGNDAFPMDTLDGNDLIEGGTGSDELVFKGTLANEGYTLSSVSTHAQLFRDVAGVLVQFNDVEDVTLHTGSGSDAVFVKDLSDTDVDNVYVDIDGTAGGDGRYDALLVSGSAKSDNVSIKTGTADAATISGLGAKITVTSSEVLNTFALDLGTGNDKVNASKLARDTAMLNIDGGPGNDMITGGAGDDFLFGSGDNDTIRCGAGGDYANGGDGTDTVTTDCELAVAFP